MTMNHFFTYYLDKKEVNTCRIINDVQCAGVVRSIHAGGSMSKDN
jgi:hypothetical protein